MYKQVVRYSYNREGESHTFQRRRQKHRTPSFMEPKTLDLKGSRDIRQERGAAQDSQGNRGCWDVLHYCCTTLCTRAGQLTAKAPILRINRVFIHSIPSTETPKCTLTTMPRELIVLSPKPLHCPYCFIQHFEPKLASTCKLPLQ